MIAYEPLKDELQSAYRDWKYESAEHHEDGRVLPDEANAGNTWRCSCGRLFATQKARSNHFHNANNRRRRMGI